jgi:hypothetical protein
MDELNLHEDQNADTQGEQSFESQSDEGKTSEGSNKKAEQVKEEQKTAWLNNIRSGKKTLDEMPANLGWLRKEIEPELAPPAEKKLEVEKKGFDISSQVQAELRKQKELEEKEVLVSFLKEGSVSDDMLSDIESNYRAFMSDGMSDFNALKSAMRVSGVKDVASIISEKKREAMLFPGVSSQERRVVNQGNGMSELEKRLSTDLPPGFSL